MLTLIHTLTRTSQWSLPDAARSGRKLISLCLLLASVAGLSACATSEPKPVSTVNPQANWATFGTVKVEDVSPIHGPALDALKNVIASTLVDKGYRVVEGTADTTFRYRVAINHDDIVHEEVIPTATGNLVRTTVDSVNEARILANLIDNDNGKVAWKATAARRLSDSSSPMSKEEMQERVQSFLSSLPVAGTQP